MSSNQSKFYLRLSVQHFLIISMKTLCVDVGSGSVRCAIFEYSSSNVLQTKPLAVKTMPLPVYNRKPDYFEQKTSDIWSAFCQCTAECLKASGLSVNLSENDSFPIDAVAFSATCSLVIVEEPRHQQNHDDAEQCDVIMWMDHRAKAEAEIISSSGHDVLKQFGGICSPEFSISKLFWLYRNDKPRFEAAQAFMELGDWLTYRSSHLFGTPQKFPRSLCCVVCKFGYDAENHKWRDDLFESLGIPFDNGFSDKIGNSVIFPGARAASLSVSAAGEIGFSFDHPTTGNSIDSVSLASSLIDAHAGVISMLVFGNRIAPSNLETHLPSYENVFCMISGTSTCHMVLNKKKCPTPGVWGPYLDAILPGYYLSEAGTTATGKLIDHVIQSHYDGKLPSSMSQIIISLNEQLKGKDFDHRNSLVMNPAFHGNRSPVANPNLRGAIYGYTLEETSLLDLYVATVEAIAYETRYIIEEIEKSSKPIQKIIVSGGLAKNELYLQLHSDILGVELVTFTAGEADLMLVGASIIALCATQVAPTDDPSKLMAILNNLSTDEPGFRTHYRVFKPRQSATEYHNRKYQCYRRLLDCCIQMEGILL